MFESDKKSPLDRLRRNLYSRKAQDVETTRHSLHEGHTQVAESWQSPDAESGPMDRPVPQLTPQRRRGYKIGLVISVAFFGLAIAIAAYTFFGGGNFISVDNVDILVEGPVAVAGGDPLALNVSVVNKNQTDIQLVDLIAEYPQGAKDPADPSKDLSRVRVSLGDIKTQSAAQKSFSALLFGQEGEGKDIKFTVEYRTADSNAIFYKEKLYHTSISSSPLLVSIDTLDKVVDGDTFDMKITVSSNATAPVKNVLLDLDYPFGFSVVSATPSATYGNNLWRIGDLAPGAKRTITVQATASGQDTEERTIHANVGIQSATNDREIATTVISQDHTFTIERPFLGLDLSLEGGHDDLATQAGRSVHADILWTNNSTSKITNARIVAKLSGNVLDRNSVQVNDGGYYDSASNSIIWEAPRADGLATVAPGSDGRVGFSVSALQALPGQSLSNPRVDITVSASGSRIDENGVSQDIQTGVTHSIRIVSNLSLSARALYSQGPIKNSGPMPPKADAATTYSIVWTVTNTSNTITGAKVTASLPPHVTWTGAVSPSDASITYDQPNNLITWIAGEIPQNADIGTGAKQVLFQLSFTPSVDQIGSVPDIIGPATITGTDVFTGASLQNNNSSLSTRISTDLLYKSGDEVVQK